MEGCPRSSGCSPDIGPSFRSCLAQDWVLQSGLTTCSGLDAILASCRDLANISATSRHLVTGLHPSSDSKDSCPSLAWTGLHYTSISRPGIDLGYGLYSSPESVFGLTLAGLGLVDTPW